MGCDLCKHLEEPAYRDWIGYVAETQATQVTQATQTAPPTVTPSPTEEDEVCLRQDSTTQTSPGDTIGCALCKHREDPAYRGWISFDAETQATQTQATQQAQATQTAPPTVTPSPAEEKGINPDPSLSPTTSCATESPAAESTAMGNLATESPASDTSRNDILKIDRKSIVLKSKIGSGVFSDVWKATWNDTVVAVKTQPMSLEAFLARANSLKDLRHPKLVDMYGICPEKPIYIVTEFMKYGDLRTYLRDGPGKTLDLRVLVDIAAQVAHGMTFFEVQGCFHKSLAAQNILVGENNTVKIAGFGLGLVGENMNRGCRLRWTAPEAVLHRRFSIKSDVWSFGIVLYEIVTKGGLPYPDLTHDEVCTQIKNGWLFRMQKPMDCPSPFFDNIMMKCWSDNPDDRYSFNYLYSYLDDYFAINS